MHRRPIHDLRTVFHRVVVGESDGLRVGDAKAVEVSRARRPGADPCAGSRLHQIDRRHAAEVMAFAIARKVSLVSAPAHLARLCALTDEAVDGPGVDELARLLRHAGRLGIALGDVHHLDAETAGQIAPVRARARLAGSDTRVGGDVEERLLYEMRHQARIRPVSQHGGRRLRVARAQGEHLLPHCIVRAPTRGHRGVGVAPRPRLDTGVDVHRTLFPAQLDQSDARDLDGHIDEKVAAPEQRVEHPAEILARERLPDDLDAQILGLLKAALMGRQDRDALGGDADVPQEQRQHALTDAAEADDQDASRELDVNFVGSHDPQSTACGRLCCGLRPTLAGIALRATREE